MKTSTDLHNIIISAIEQNTDVILSTPENGSNFIILEDCGWNVNVTFSYFIDERERLNVEVSDLDAFYYDEEENRITDFDEKTIRAEITFIENEIKEILN